LVWPADRFSNRAEAIENRSSNLNAFAAIAAEYGITPSRSVSRTTVRTTNELQVTAEQTHLLSRICFTLKEKCPLLMQRGRVSRDHKKMRML